MDTCRPGHYGDMYHIGTNHIFVRTVENDTRRKTVHVAGGILRRGNRSFDVVCVLDSFEHPGHILGGRHIPDRYRRVYNVVHGFHGANRIFKAESEK